MISAILGKKLNMSARFDQNGRRMPVTLIEVGPCTVATKKIEEKVGYNAIVIQLLKNKRKAVLKEVKVGNFDQIEIGQKIDINNFKTGDLVKLAGTSKGKGFTGVVKRWGFAGGPKTHGQSDRHRAPGSIGSGTTPGRVYKGKKMAGRMGTGQVTIPETEIVEVNEDENILTVKGPVPGHFNSIVLITKIGEKKSDIRDSKKLESEEKTENSANEESEK